MPTYVPLTGGVVCSRCTKFRSIAPSITLIGLFNGSVWSWSSAPFSAFIKVNPQRCKEPIRIPRASRGAVRSLSALPLEAVEGGGRTYVRYGPSSGNHKIMGGR